MCAIRLWSGPNNIAPLLREAFARREDCSIGATAAGQPLWLQSPALAALSWIGADWGDGEQHVLLIRDPRAVLALGAPTSPSALEAMPARTPALPGPQLRAEDLGLPQLNRLFERVVDRSGQSPAIIDAERFLLDPDGHLRALCRRLGVQFQPRMGHAMDRRLVDATRKRLGNVFSALPGQGDELLAECMPMYQRLYQHRLQPDGHLAMCEQAAPH